MLRAIGLTVVAVGLVGSASAQAYLFKPRKTEQVKLGRQAADEIRQKERVLPDSDSRVQLLRRVGERLLRHVDLSKEPWQFSFDVIESKELNAFALPGGPVFFYTGLLEKMKTEDELAAVLGHEIAHVTREHWARAYGERQARGLGVFVILGLARVGNTAASALDVLNSLYSLQYSRGDEINSDELGYRWMTEAGYNPQGMIDVFRMLSQASSGGRQAEFLSTHPSDSNRIRKLEDRIRKDRREFPPQRPLDL